MVLFLSIVLASLVPETDTTAVACYNTSFSEHRSSTPMSKRQRDLFQPDPAPWDMDDADERLIATVVFANRRTVPSIMPCRRRWLGGRRRQTRACAAGPRESGADGLVCPCPVRPGGKQTAEGDLGSWMTSRC
jgi:hypothetical protein